MSEDTESYKVFAIKQKIEELKNKVKRLAVGSPERINVFKRIEELKQDLES